MRRLDRRELLEAELVEALGPGQVLEALLAEVEELDLRHELARHLRDEHLAAVAGGGDARGAVDVHADVEAVGR